MQAKGIIGGGNALCDELLLIIYVSRNSQYFPSAYASVIERFTANQQLRQPQNFFRAIYECNQTWTPSVHLVT